MAKTSKALIERLSRDEADSTIATKVLRWEARGKSYYRRDGSYQGRIRNFQPSWMEHSAIVAIEDWARQKRGRTWTIEGGDSDRYSVTLYPEADSEDAFIGDFSFTGRTIANAASGALLMTLENAPRHRSS